jgi:hypothetical protein
MIKERKEISLLFKEAQEVGARQSKACEIVGISEKTFAYCGLKIITSLSLRFPDFQRLLAHNG